MLQPDRMQRGNVYGGREPEGRERTIFGTAVIVKRHRGRPRKDEGPLVCDAYTPEQIAEANMLFDIKMNRHPGWWVPAPSGFDRRLENRELDLIVVPYHGALTIRLLFLAEERLNKFHG